MAKKKNDNALGALFLAAVLLVVGAIARTTILFVAHLIEPYIPKEIIRKTGTGFALFIVSGLCMFYAYYNLIRNSIGNDNLGPYIWALMSFSAFLGLAIPSIFMALNEVISGDHKSKAKKSKFAGALDWTSACSIVFLLATALFYIRASNMFRISDDVMLAIFAFGAVLYATVMIIAPFLFIWIWVRYLRRYANSAVST